MSASPGGLAVCLAGEARSLIMRCVYRSIRAHLLAPLEALDNVTTLLVITEDSTGGADEDQTVLGGVRRSAAEERALEHLRPAVIRRIRHERLGAGQAHGCSGARACALSGTPSPSAEQFLAQQRTWRHCLTAVEQEEHLRGRPFTAVVRTRPDVWWSAPLPADVAHSLRSTAYVPVRYDAYRHACVETAVHRLPKPYLAISDWFASTPRALTAAALGFHDDFCDACHTVGSFSFDERLPKPQLLWTAEGLLAARLAIATSALDMRPVSVVRLPATVVRLWNGSWSARETFSDLHKFTKWSGANCSQLDESCYANRLWHASRGSPGGIACSGASAWLAAESDRVCADAKWGDYAGLKRSLWRLKSVRELNPRLAEKAAAAVGAPVGLGDLGAREKAWPLSSASSSPPPPQPQAALLMHDILASASATAAPTTANNFTLTHQKLHELAQRHAASYRAAAPFPHVKLDQLFPPLPLEALAAEVPERMLPSGCVAGAAACYRKLGVHYRKSELHDSAHGPYTKLLFQTLRSPRFVGFLEKLTGHSGLIADPGYQGSGVHLTGRGGVLAVHHDFNFMRCQSMPQEGDGEEEQGGGGVEQQQQQQQRRPRQQHGVGPSTMPPRYGNCRRGADPVASSSTTSSSTSSSTGYHLLHRRVNVFVYLNRHWQSEWGGHLELFGRNLSAGCMQSIPPSFGTFVAFSSTDFSYHGHPTPMDKLPKDRMRRSIAFYYYTVGQRPVDECEGKQCEAFHDARWYEAGGCSTLQ